MSENKTESVDQIADKILEELEKVFQRIKDKAPKKESDEAPKPEKNQVSGMQITEEFEEVLKLVVRKMPRFIVTQEKFTYSGPFDLIRGVTDMVEKDYYKFKKKFVEENEEEETKDKKEEEKEPVKKGPTVLNSHSGCTKSEFVHWYNRIFSGTDSSVMLASLLSSAERMKEDKEMDHVTQIVQVIGKICCAAPESMKEEVISELKSIGIQVELVASEK